MSSWILKSEPSTYSFEHLVRDKRATWDGVSNPQALNNIRSMKKGDRVLIYHSGEGKCCVGLAEIASDPYADPKKNDPRLAVVDIIPKKAITRQVTLAEIKANPKLKDLKIVRQPRLSVIPVPDAAWEELMKMAGEK